MGRFGFRTAFAVSTLLIVVRTFPAEGIGRKDFFEKLDRSLRSIQTFQAKVIQESIYPDGVVQRYRGDLAVSDEGRIAYKYDLVGEYEDPSLASREEAPQAEEIPVLEQHHPSNQSGVYITKRDRVVHYNKEQNFLVESPEEENLLIQLFRILVGAGEFDVEKFQDNHKIQRIQEEHLDGVPVFVMIAEPRKNSDLYRKWAQHTSNKMVNWRQELWVKQSNLEPMKAVLTMEGESTTILLREVRVNQPVDPSRFLVDPPKGVPPKRFTRRPLLSPPSDLEGPGPIEAPLREIRVEQ